MKALAVIILFGTLQLLAEDLSELKKIGFVGSTMDLNWGDEVSDDILSNVACPKNASPIEILPKWTTGDWCEKLQNDTTISPTGILCAKKLWPSKPIEYCYTGSNNTKERQGLPSPEVALFLFNQIKEVPSMESEGIFVGSKDLNEYGFRLFPVSFEGAEIVTHAVNFYDKAVLRYVGFPQSNTRFLISFLGRVIGFASSSEIPEKRDPKYFLIQSEKKYGPATTKKSLKPPLQGRYSDCWIWNNKTDRFAQVTCITPKELSGSGKPSIDNIFLEKKTWNDLANKISTAKDAAEKKSINSKKIKSKEEDKHVDF